MLENYNKLGENAGCIRSNLLNNKKWGALNKTRSRGNYKKSIRERYIQTIRLNKNIERDECEVFGSSVYFSDLCHISTQTYLCVVGYVDICTMVKLFNTI